MILIPIERAWRATIHLQSGAELEFTAANISAGDPGNVLREVAATDSRGSYPFYLRLDDVSAIELRRVWRLRWITVGGALIWVLALAVALWALGY